MVGESPPPSGHFFYQASDERIFTSITRKAFTTAFDREYEGVQDFLDDFKSHGFFLDELYDSPQDDVPTAEKEKLERQAISQLAQRLGEYRPERLLVFSLRIESAVREATARAGLDNIIERSYYMGKLYQYEYHAGLVGWFSDIRNKAFTT